MRGSIRSRRRCGRLLERLAAVGARVDMTDGLRVTEPEGGRLLRASGTEPKAHHSLRSGR